MFTKFGSTPRPLRIGKPNTDLGRIPLRTGPDSGRLKSGPMPGHLSSCMCPDLTSVRPNSLTDHKLDCGPPRVAEWDTNHVRTIWGLSVGPPDSASRGVGGGGKDFPLIRKSLLASPGKSCFTRRVSFTRRTEVSRVGGRADFVIREFVRPDPTRSILYFPPFRILIESGFLRA